MSGGVGGRRPRLVEARVVGVGDGSWFRCEGEDAETFCARGVIPGERVLLRARTDDPAWADLEEIVEPSAHRRAAACPLAARCGGCHWLHVDDELQRELKLGQLVDRLAARGLGVGRAQIAWHASPKQLGYRHRARFQVQGREIGFHAQGSREIVDAPDCPLLAPELRAAYRRVRERLRRRPIAGLTGFELTALPAAGGALLVLNPRDAAPARWPACGDELLEALSETVAGVAAQPRRGQDLPRVRGAAAAVGESARGRPVAAATRGFVQANLDAAENLADGVVRLAAPDAGEPILELFAGSAFLGWRLAAAGARVTAIESDRAAIEAARLLPPPHSVASEANRTTKDAARHLPPPHARSREPNRTAKDAARHLPPPHARSREPNRTAKDAARHLPIQAAGALELVHADARDIALTQTRTALVDPPRAGLGALAERLAARGPERLVVVSCYPDSLARDLAILCRDGYAIRALEAHDLFPQTRHLETVTLLERPA